MLRPGDLDRPAGPDLVGDADLPEPVPADSGGLGGLELPRQRDFRMGC